MVEALVRQAKGPGSIRLMGYIFEARIWCPRCDFAVLFLQFILTYSLHHYHMQNHSLMWHRWPSRLRLFTQQHNIKRATDPQETMFGHHTKYRWPFPLLY